MKKYLYLDQLREGEMLYHYTKCEAAASILRSRDLFATKSSFLNDSNEMGFILHVAQQVIGELPSKKWQNLLLKELTETMEDFRRHDNYVLSLSEEADSITLWSEFGEETGYNLAFDGTELLSCISEHHRIACHGRVIYRRAEQEEILRNLLLTIIPGKIGMPFAEIVSLAAQEKDTVPFSQLCRKFGNALGVYALFFKQEEFQPEREYRCVFRPESPKEVHFRSKEGFLLPYMIISVSDEKVLPVRKITVAPKNHVDLARKGMLLYTRSLGYDTEVSLSNLKLRY